MYKTTYLNLPASKTAYLPAPPHLHLHLVPLHHPLPRFWKKKRVLFAHVRISGGEQFALFWWSSPFITHSSCHYSPLTHFIIRSRTYAWRVWYGGGGGWVGGGDNDVRYNYWTHCVRRWSSPFHHAFILPLLTSHALHHSFPHIRMEGMVCGGGVGGWVGGGDNDVRYNYWTHCVRQWSSPFHHAFILPLLTSHALHHSFPHIRMEGMVCGGGWVGGIMTFVTTTGHIVSVDDHHPFILWAVAPQLRHGSLAKRSWPVPCLKKDLPAAVPGWSIELWFLIPEHIFHWWWTMIETTKNTTAATADVTFLLNVL